MQTNTDIGLVDITFIMVLALMTGLVGFGSAALRDARALVDRYKSRSKKGESSESGADNPG